MPFSYYKGDFEKARKFNVFCLIDDLCALKR